MKQSADTARLEDENKSSVARELLRLPVVVAALGYLVDMYDLFLFSIVRVTSPNPPPIK